MPNPTLKAGVVGGTGYTGAELLRLLSAHPSVTVTAVTSRAEAGQPVASLLPALRGVVELAFTNPEKADLADCDVVLFATPNGVAMHQAAALLAAGVRVIDLAADFRLRDPAVWAEWYGEAHAAPELLGEAVYGLTEWHRPKLVDARLVANPGCYPTAVQMGLAPLLEAGAITVDGIIADAKSGVSGAGRKAATGLLMGEVGESFKAYGVAGHRHLPEIRQGLAAVAGRDPELTFVPHLVPMVRGIEATLYARATDPGTDFQALFETRYRDEPFVDVLPPGTFPETRNVRGTNQCQIAVARPQEGSTVVVSVVIDNLVKGAAGQAVQNMNAIFGLPETTGLEAAPVWP